MYSELHSRSALLFRPPPPTISTTDNLSNNLNQDLTFAITGNSTTQNNKIQHYLHNRPTRQPLNGKVLLFYHYCTISNPQELLLWQQTLCQLLRLRGRIHVGKEGINGTVGGSLEAIELYKNSFRVHAIWSNRFKAMEFKESLGGHHCFPNLFIRVCTEICQMNASPEQIHWKDTGIHLKPSEFHAAVQEMNQNKNRNQEDIVLLDVRNLYESNVGHFDGAVRLATRHFTDFPKIADDLIIKHALHTKKKVLMYCTGGIRCERASSYFRSKGIQTCYQLEGGIHKYIEEMGNETLFRGKNFVFDRRLTTERVGTALPISQCIQCLSKYDEYDKQYNCTTCSCLVLLCQQCQPQLDKNVQRNKKQKKKMKSMVLYCNECRPLRSKGNKKVTFGRTTEILTPIRCVVNPLCALLECEDMKAATKILRYSCAKLNFKQPNGFKKKHAKLWNNVLKSMKQDTCTIEGEELHDLIMEMYTNMPEGATKWNREHVVRLSKEM